jgi:hypothetical protein
MDGDRDFNRQLREILSEAAAPVERPRAAPADHRRDFSALEERRPGTDHPGTKSRIQQIVEQAFDNGGRNRQPLDEEKIGKIAQQLQEQAEKAEKSQLQFKKAANTAKVVEVAKTGLTDDTPAPVKAKFVKRKKDIAS